MLVLSRNSHEKIVFPTLGVSVEILEVKGNKVRIGIDAPTDIPVHRSEVAERLFREGLRHERPK
jgi:carbon storage regulator